MVTEAASNSFQHSTKQKHGWIEAFDPILQTWEPLPDPPFIVTRNMPFLALESQKQILAIAYFIEEEDGNRVQYAKFHTYDVTTRCWTTLVPSVHKIDVFL